MHYRQKVGDTERTAEETLALGITMTLPDDEFFTTSCFHMHKSSDCLNTQTLSSHPLRA